MVTQGAVDVGSTRPFVLFSFLERYLQREGFGTKFLFDSPTGGDALYELAEADERLADESETNAAELALGGLLGPAVEGYGAGDGPGEDDEDITAEGIERRAGRWTGPGGLGGSGMGLFPVPRSDVDRWVKVCFGTDRQGREWPPAAPHARVALTDALKTFGHPAVALYLLGTHYTQPLGDAQMGLATGARHAQRIREVVASLAPGKPSPPQMRRYLDEFSDALADDLDTPNAFVSMFEWVLAAERHGGKVGDRDLRAMLEVFELGDLLAPPHARRAR